MVTQYFATTPGGVHCAWEITEGGVVTVLEGDESLARGLAEAMNRADGRLPGTMPIAVQVSLSPVLLKSIEALKQECDWLRAAKDAAVADAKAYMNLYIERVAEPPPPPRPSPDKIMAVLAVMGAVLILSYPVLEALHVFRF